MIGKQNSRHFLNQWESKPKPIVPRSHAFSRAWRRLHVFTLNRDWFIALFTSAVIGQNNNCPLDLVLPHPALIYNPVHFRPKDFTTCLNGSSVLVTVIVLFCI